MPNAFPGPADAATPPDGKAAKVALRDRLLTARNARSLADIGASGRAIAGHLLAAEEVRRAASVSLYVSVGPEPGTGALLDALVEQGKRVILPVTFRTESGLDLDWAVYEGPDSLAPAGYGLLEPTTPRLGVDAIGTPDAVLVPGLAVGPTGARIGRGAGCYDRALSRVPAGTFVCALLYADEVSVDVPAEPHDRPVTATVTPDGLTRLNP